MTSTHDRRQSARLQGEEHGILRARVRPGQDVAVIDACLGGLLIETERRLLPGAPIDIHLATTNGLVSVRGCVLRCAVARLRPTGVFYRGAIGFERHLSCIARGLDSHSLVG
ncbi:MAG TPA: hypothetical protein VHZ73_13125 [Vicinamibacterales bacterium]|jgi:hypothetical protein|nr:hypothetical protein [Vicinamibacterales bacterium]